MNRDFNSYAGTQRNRRPSNAIAVAIDKVSYTLKRLHAMNYDAPWKREAAASRNGNPRP